MTTTITLDEAQAQLKDLIDKLAPGEEILITKDQRTVAKLVIEPALSRKPRIPGLGKGMITLLVEDDEHLEGFAEYMK